MEDICNKSPSKMNDNEKVIWKVEVFKQSEDVDEILDQRIKMIQEERDNIKNAISNNNNVINTYEQAVDRIGNRAK